MLEGGPTLDQFARPFLKPTLYANVEGVRRSPDNESLIRKRDRSLLPTASHTSFVCDPDYTAHPYTRDHLSPPKANMDSSVEAEHLHHPSPLLHLLSLSQVPLPLRTSPHPLRSHHDPLYHLRLHQPLPSPLAYLGGHGDEEILRRTRIFSVERLIMIYPLHQRRSIERGRGRR